jgi:hypothetical protein
MTTLVAIQNKDWCIIAADSQATDSFRKYDISPTGKINLNNGYLFASAGLCRGQNLLAFGWTPPRPPKQNLDKFITMSDGKCTPKVIIRVSVGSESPVDPQCQHKGNFTTAFRHMLQNIEIIELIEPEDIIPAYEKALNREDGVSTILVEFMDYTRTK